MDDDLVTWVTLFTIREGEERGEGGLFSYSLKYAPFHMFTQHESTSRTSLTEAYRPM